MTKKTTRARAVKWRPRREGEPDAVWAAFLRKWNEPLARHPGRDWVVRAQDKRGEVVNVGTHSNPWSTFDELVVDHWIHLEQMDTRTWYLGVGDHQLSIYIPRNGAPPILSHYELGDLATLVKRPRKP